MKDLCKNAVEDEYICTCIGEFPDVYFTTPDGHKFHVVPDDYMVPLVGEAFCLLGIMQMEIDIPVMIFGDAFMRNYFVVYDKVNKKVGFSGLINFFFFSFIFCFFLVQSNEAIKQKKSFFEEKKKLKINYKKFNQKKNK